MQLVALVVLRPVNHSALANFRRLADSPALLWYGTLHFRVGDRRKVLAKVARPALKQRMAALGQWRLRRRRRTSALGSGTAPERTGPHRAQLHRVRAGIAQLEDFEAFLERWPVQQLPAAGLAGAGIFVGVAPRGRDDCGQRRRLQVVERQDAHPDGCMPHHRSVFINISWPRKDADLLGSARTRS
uniref:(northern house mosquito) hypothetical protein n=1 Tax=Culex pipiens TaxID=7175 RepID=A0A8D8ANR6_CULPI